MEIRKKFGAIGMGNMGGAIVNGSVNCNVFAAGEIGVYDLYQPKVEACRAKGYSIFDNEEQAYTNTEILLLAVKPQNFTELMEKLSKVDCGDPNQIVVTIAAGISIAHIKKSLGSDKKVVRVMPNTPLLIGEGACAFSRCENVTDGEFERVMNIFRGLGQVVVIDESQMETIIPANGSSPAFVYYFIKCLANTCEKMGVDRGTAISLLCKSFIGSAKMVLESGDDLDTLIKNVCSPKGATLEAIQVFDEEGLEDIIYKGCLNCVNRAKELGQ